VLIGVAISGDTNVMKKEAEKLLNYKHLIMEIERQWNVKINVTPAITGATRTISKSLKKIPQQHTRKARNQETAENIHIWHSTHTSESANVKVQNIQGWKYHYMYHKL
jgi:hypothetical protein